MEFSETRLNSGVLFLLAGLRSGRIVCITPTVRTLSGPTTTTAIPRKTATLSYQQYPLPPLHLSLRLNRHVEPPSLVTLCAPRCSGAGSDRGRKSRSILLVILVLAPYRPLSGRIPTPNRRPNAAKLTLIWNRRSPKPHRYGVLSVRWGF
jgi:hypothetical protein